MARTGNKRLRVVVTGATGDVGHLVLPRLLADEGVESVIAVDIAKPPDHEKLSYERIDFTRHDADEALTDVLRASPVDAVYHLSFLYGPRRDAGMAHEVEVIGTMRVLEALSRAPVPRLIVPSLTALYGARPSHPALLREDSPLLGCPESRFISDKVDVERQIERFREAQPDVHVIVLRMAPIVGPTMDNPLTRLISKSVVPTLFGFDPLLQTLNEEDATRALHLALRTERAGTFNIVSAPSPLSTLIRAAGNTVLPLPGPLARRALRALNSWGGIGVPMPLLDYIHYGWVADDARARHELGFTPAHRSLDAAAALRRA
jgi:UDP-glucose 4-epimerase